MGEQARKRGEGVQIYQARQLLICIFSFSSYLGQVKPSTFIQALDTNCYRRCTTFDCNRRIAYILCQSFSSSKPGHKLRATVRMCSLCPMVSSELFKLTTTHLLITCFRAFSGPTFRSWSEDCLFCVADLFVCLFVCLTSTTRRRQCSEYFVQRATHKKTQQQQLGSPLLSNHSLGSKRCLR